MITIELQKANGEHVAIADVDVSPVGIMPQCVLYWETLSRGSLEGDRIFAVSEWDEENGRWVYREVTKMRAYSPMRTIA